MRLCHFSLLLTFALLTACSTPTYTYQYRSGRTATVQNGFAIAPPKAPPAVQAAIAAGNRITGLPYAYGGGHGSGSDGAFDCSGATSFVLQAAGKLQSPMPSTGFRYYGERGEGKWISIYARRGHVFLVVAGLRFDTGWNGDHSEGPRWTTRSRTARGCVIRHPDGL